MAMCTKPAKSSLVFPPATPASIRNGLVDVRALAGVRLGVIQLAGTDLQKARITRHAAGFTDAA